MFGEVVAKIFCAGPPVDDELVLFDSIADPIEAHIHGARFALLQSIVRDAGGGGVVCLNRGWWLGVV